MQVAGIFGDGTFIQGKRQFPGTCTGDSTRLCLSDGDCHITDLNEESKGTCVLPPIQNVNWRARDLIIENNTIINPSMVGIVSVGENLNFKGNKISGATTATAIQVAGPYALETSIFTQNIVSTVSQALNFGQVFQGTFPSFFGAKFSLNDFTDYSTAVSLQGTCALDSRLFCVNNAQCVVQGVNFGPCVSSYTLPTELSVDDQSKVCGPDSTGCQGNNWGLTCESGGFDPNKVKNFNGTVNSNVVDSHPYDVNEPVGVIVTDNGPCDNVSKTCSGDSALTCFTDANCIDYVYRDAPPLACPEQGF